MKSISKLLFPLFLILSLAACTTETEYGQCIGAFDDKDPKLVYKVSTWNVFLGVFFFEVIVPPIIVIANSTFCPVGRK